MGFRNRSLQEIETCFFVTSSTYQRKGIFNDPEIYNIIGKSLQFTGEKYKAVYLGYVFLPNHIHLIIRFTAENRLSDLMRDFKKSTAGEIRRWIENNNSKEVEKLRFVIADQQFKVWADRFHDKAISSEKMLENCLEYMHNNPPQERWKLTKSPEDYFHFSAKFYFRGIQSLAEVNRYKEW